MKAKEEKRLAKLTEIIKVRELTEIEKEQYDDLMLTKKIESMSDEELIEAFKTL
jgi:hypothetical protein